MNETPGSSSSSEPNSNADDEPSTGIDTAATSPEKDPTPDSGKGDDGTAAPVPDAPVGAKEPEEVPDILYCLDYRDFAGDLIQRKKDSKPIDVNSLAKAKNTEDIVVEKKPVLEIVTEITAQVNRTRRRAYPSRRRYSRSRSSSRSLSPVSSRSRSPPGPPPPPGGRVYHVLDSDEEAEPLEISKVGKTSMLIHSPYLNNAIRHVVKYYPGTSLHVSIYHLTGLVSC